MYYSVVDASTRGIAAHFEQNQSPLRRGNIIIPLKHERGELGVCSLLVERGWSTSAEGSNSRDSAAVSGVAMTVTADNEQCRMEHVHEKMLGKLRNTPGTAENVRGDISSCRSKQQEHSKKVKKAKIPLTSPLELSLIHI